MYHTSNSNSNSNSNSSNSNDNTNSNTNNSNTNSNSHNSNSNNTGINNYRNNRNNGNTNINNTNNSNHSNNSNNTNTNNTNTNINTNSHTNGPSKPHHHNHNHNHSHNQNPRNSGALVDTRTDAPGLEFEHPTTKTWHSVPHIPNAIIMNVGDVLDRLTAGKFVSAYHRARNLSATEPRLSLPFFYDPAWNAGIKTLALTNREVYDTPQRNERWANTKIMCSFDDEAVEYSEFLAKKVAKVFPDLIPEGIWSTLSSTSTPSTRHAFVVAAPDKTFADKVIACLTHFYNENTHIKVSHGLQHVMAVYDHASKAIASMSPPLSAEVAMEIKVAALLHDVDDRKYFPDTHNYANARKLMGLTKLTTKSQDRIVYMIELVGCSDNGNSVLKEIHDAKAYHLLIPRWADRLEAVGAVGVVRCYQYNMEKGQPLFSVTSPRSTTVAEVWAHAKPQRFDEYQQRGGSSDDMISHYYDKLLHIAAPPRNIVCNTYLEKAAEESSKELIEMCVRFGQTGRVDEKYINDLATTIVDAEQHSS